MRRGFLVLGSVFLVVTGGEALYADMGHFGRTPIRARLVRRWCFPALPLNYFGQGALLLDDPAAIENPFFLLAPRLGPLAAGRARDGRHGDRVAGADLRRVLAHVRRRSSSATSPA